MLDEDDDDLVDPEEYDDLEGLFDALLQAGDRGDGAARRRRRDGCRPRPEPRRAPGAGLRMGPELAASHGAQRRRIVVRSWEESRGIWRAEVVHDSEPGGSTLGWYADSAVSRDRAFGMLRQDIKEQKGSSGIDFVHNPD
jgi:hypothetical protein